jgi:tetratricopeptide (TPR) repeat protein
MTAIYGRYSILKNLTGMPALLLLAALLAASPVQAKRNSRQQPEGEGGFTRDTAVIEQFFRDGYRFVHGPSDSLLHYFGLARELVVQNIDSLLEAGLAPAEFPMDVFKRYQARICLEYGIEYFFGSSYDSALACFDRALATAQELNDPALLSESYSEIGIVLKNQGKLAEALFHYEKALEYAYSCGDSSWIAACRVNLGNVYKEKGYLFTALQYYIDALKILEDLGHDKRIAVCLQNIGAVYSKQDDHQNALRYYFRALELSAAINDPVRESACNMGIGYIYARKGQYGPAREYYEKARLYYMQSDYNHQYDECLLLIGKSWHEEGEHERALRYYEQAMELSSGENDQTTMAEILLGMSEIHLLKGMPAKAREHAARALGLAGESGSVELESRAHAILSDIALAAGESGPALEYFKEHARLKDSIFNTAKYKAIAELEKKYESEKREQQIALLSEQTEVQKLKILNRNRILITMAGGVLLVLLLLYLFFVQSRLKSRKKAAELEQKLLRSQMNPHFIFNTMIAIQNYIYRSEPVKAADFLARFAELVRQTLESSRGDFILFGKEVSMLTTYLELQKLRFAGKFDYMIRVDPAIDEEMVMIPSMFAQPFVENAIEHGLRNKAENGLVSVVYTLPEAGRIRIRVEDNGLGLRKSRQGKDMKKHPGLALAITRERLEMLSGGRRRKFRLQITDLETLMQGEQGVRVEIDIPCRC